MPYKSRKNRAKYQKKYRQHKQRKLKAVEKAVAKGDLTLAKRALDKRPGIHLKRRGRKK